MRSPWTNDSRARCASDGSDRWTPASVPRSYRESNGELDAFTGTRNVHLCSTRDYTDIAHLDRVCPASRSAREAEDCEGQRALHIRQSAVPHTRVRRGD